MRSPGRASIGRQSTSAALTVVRLVSGWSQSVPAGSAQPRVDARGTTVSVVSAVDQPLLTILRV